MLNVRAHLIGTGSAAATAGLGLKDVADFVIVFSCTC